MKKILKKFLNYVIRIIKTEQIVAVPKIVSNEKLLKDKIALITGGSGGIGFSIAEEFINQGCKVIITGTNKKKLEESCLKLGDNSKYIVLDLLNVDNIKLSEMLEKYEEKRIDILVNSAGVTGFTNFFDVTENEYDKIMDLNLKGTFFMCQIISKYMIKNKIKGHILNVSSSSAIRPAWKPYQISKWGIKGFTLGLADTLLPYGIIVNAIAPGPVATDMLGVSENGNIYNSESVNGRFAIPREIANLAVYMVSDLGNLIVGDTFYITGGSGLINLHK